MQRFPLVGRSLSKKSSCASLCSLGAKPVDFTASSPYIPFSICSYFLRWQPAGVRCLPHTFVSCGVIVSGCSQAAFLFV